MPGPGAPIPEGQSVHYALSEGQKSQGNDKKDKAALVRYVKEQKREQIRMARLLAGKNPDTVMERIAGAAKKLYPKHTLTKVFQEGRLTMARILGQTREPIYREGEGVYDGALAKKLQRHGLTPEKLAENAQRYPELVRELTEEEQRQVGLIRDVLLNYVPLIHATRKEIPESEDLQPAKEIANESNTNTNTTVLDQDLGLDEYTFFHWGFPTRKYGTNFLLIDAHMLLDEHTMVTPRDIFDSAITMTKHFVQLPHDRRRGIRDNYFNKMVTGERWVELMARRVLFGYQEAKAEGKQFLFREDEGSDMGEVKVHGTVSPNRIIGRVSAQQTATGDASVIPVWQSLYSHGLAYGHLEEARKEVVADGVTSGQTPEDIGVDYEQAVHFWERLLEPQTPQPSTYQKSGSKETP